MTSVTATGPRAFAPQELVGLRPHVVNLSEGSFSSDGQFTTTPADVDAIFHSHLPEFIKKNKGAGPTPVVLWAHGGLVNETGGLKIARTQYQWWLDNKVYPIHFAWEAGLEDALRQLFRSATGRRGLGEKIVNEAAEYVGRHLGGTKIWGAMKRSAELSSAHAGGARYVAERLARFCSDNPGAVELHAIGHSGVHLPFPLHSHGARGRRAFLRLPVPACSSDSHRRVQRTAHATCPGQEHRAARYVPMRREYERVDVCGFGNFTFYYHSLLYLIRAALERESGAAILGLEESLQADDGLLDFFGLKGTPGAASVVWSVTAGQSESTSHGGFDNDPATMDSVAGGITKLLTPFPKSQVRAPTWTTELPGGLELIGPASPTSARRATKRALCVGIDAYPEDDRLYGCVADARQWATTLKARGFAVELLLDEEATDDTIVDRLRALIAESTAGDVIVYQFAGHGTEVPDEDGDEVAGTNGPRDEAMCPIDFNKGRLLVDDEVGSLLDDLPAGVTCTLFLDCCHSGTGSRMFIGGGAGQLGGEQRLPRYIPATPRLLQDYLAYAQNRGPIERNWAARLCAR